MAKQNQFDRCKEVFSNFNWANVQHAQNEENEYQSKIEEIEKWRKEYDNSQAVDFNSSMTHAKFKAENDKFKGESYEYREFRNKRKKSYLDTMINFNGEVV